MGWSLDASTSWEGWRQGGERGVGVACEEMWSANYLQSGITGGVGIAAPVGYAPTIPVAHESLANEPTISVDHERIIHVVHEPIIPAAQGHTIPMDQGHTIHVGQGHTTPIGQGHSIHVG